MATSAELAAIADLLDSRPPQLGTGRLLCVDGPAGSGKTTLATALVDVLASRGRRVALLHMDDLYEGWEGLRPDLERRLLTQVFAPLSRGTATRWQRYDWSRGVLADWVRLDLTDVLVVEGCGSGAVAYAPYRSVLVWVEASRDIRIGRGLARDGADVETHWLAWMDLEAAYFRANDTAAQADVRITTDNEAP